MSDWEHLASFLAALTEEDRARFSAYAALDLPEGSTEEMFRALRSYAVIAPGTSPSSLLATTGAQAGAAGDGELALTLGRGALELARTPGDLGLAHVCLAQTHFRGRRDPAELERFVEHCRAAIAAGHAGTFCYERLAVLYEYRGEGGEAAEICRRAVEVLSAAGDDRSAARFRKRLERLSGG
ncbi:hypothetical protein GBA65_13950 [Rubrobacter marinus]|uniref:Tetratricopeptide repeat protein n=1 Tax=Rubrobacter marinus TaxID=2653852 RepID=A0A6G8PZ11_9ACTN|nr:hypothetical protein [Rubrobacter marinus]QIN79432.1 hypothetical protein GBA65_13950 [Rubrobacter marinus]